AERTIEAIEGRADEVLWLPALDGGELRPLYPDLVRRALTTAAAEIREWSIRQQGMTWQLGLLADDPERQRTAIEQALGNLFQQQGVRPAQLRFGPWQAAETGAKRRRLLLEQRPQEPACTSPACTS